MKTLLEKGKRTSKRWREKKKEKEQVFTKQQINE